MLICGGSRHGEGPTRRSYIFEIDQRNFHSFAQIPSESKVLFDDKHFQRKGNVLYYFNTADEILKYDILKNTWKRKVLI